MTANVGSNTQGWIASASWRMSSRKEARAARCTPKTTAAALGRIADVGGQPFCPVAKTQRLVIKVLFR